MRTKEQIDVEVKGFLEKWDKEFQVPIQFDEVLPVLDKFFKEKVYRFLVQRVDHFPLCDLLNFKDALEAKAKEKVAKKK